MRIIFLCNLLAFVFILSFIQIAVAKEPYVEIWRYGPSGMDVPIECDDSTRFALYPDETLGEFCYCKKEIIGEDTTYKWCQLDGDACGTSTSCD